MTVDWLQAASKIRGEATHWARRLVRMELMALGGRVDWTVYGESRAFVEGIAEAYKQAVQIIGEARVVGPTPTLDMAVILLAREGLPVDVIANRCGVSERDVAETLIRYVQSLVEEELGEKGGPE